MHHSQMKSHYGWRFVSLPPAWKNVAMVQWVVQGKRRLSPKFGLSNTGLERCNLSLQFLAALLFAIRAQANPLPAARARRLYAVAFLRRDQVSIENIAG